MPAEFASQAYWDKRFDSEDRFEWLGDGVSTLLPLLVSFLCRWHSGSDAHGEPDLQGVEGERSTDVPPRLLHIGAGTSTLHRSILEAYEERFGQGECCWAEEAESSIVNVDFSESAVLKGQQAVEEEGKRKSWLGLVSWAQADLLHWADVESLLYVRTRKDDRPQRELFHIVIDKSTSDAISCGEDVVFSGASAPSLSSQSTVRQRCSIVEAFLSDEEAVTQPKSSSSPSLCLPPVQLLALHLAEVVGPGGVWICMSYSSARFDFLSVTNGKASSGRTGGNRGVPDPGTFWTLESVQPVEAPSGQHREGVHAPPVCHYVYVLRRTFRASGRPVVQCKGEP